MAFLNPSFLWAFLGLAIPLAIHLWSRKEGRTIKIGSIQFLKDSDPKQASSIKLNELWLLFLRLLILSLLVLIIAGPVFKKDNSRTPITYFIEPSLTQNEGIERILDTLDPWVEVRLLSKDFPEYIKGEDIDHKEIPDYWQLVNEMDKLYSDSIVVFTAGYTTGFKGRRPKTDQNINWVQVIPDEKIDAPFAAITKGDEVEIISVSGDHSSLGIKKEITSPDNKEFKRYTSGDSIVIIRGGDEIKVRLWNADTLRVSLYHDEDLEDQMIYIRSSLNAISEYLRTPINITKVESEESISEEEDLLVWISKSSFREKEFPILKWQPDSLSNSLIEKGKTKKLYHLTRILNSENIVEEHFPEQLLQILNINENLEKEIAKYDRRVMPMEEIVPVTGSLGNRTEITNSMDISNYLWYILGIILIAERGLSVYRKQ